MVIAFTRVGRSGSTKLGHETSTVRQTIRRRANRAERYYPIFKQIAEWEDVDVDIPMPSKDDVRCSGCRKEWPSHKVITVRRKTIGPCDCCEHWDEESFGPCCIVQR